MSVRAETVNSLVSILSKTTRKDAPGASVGSYETTGHLGSGGRRDGRCAHDSRSHRDVAIKFSAERFSNRFEREARGVAPLNDARLRMVECESRQGLRPLDESLRIIRQIAPA